MNFKKILFVSIFMLAIMTLGTVSAADDAGNLTVSEEVGDIIESPADEINVAAAENSGSEVIGEGKEIEMNISIPDEIFLDEDFMPIVSVPEDRTGSLSFYIDDNEQYYDVEEYGKYYFSCVLNEFGQHTFKASYAAGEDDIYSDTVVEIPYFMNNTQYRISLSDVVYGDDFICLNANYMIRSDVVITIDGKKYDSTVRDTDNNYVWGFEVPELALGENEVSVYYPGDEDFAEYSQLQTIHVLAEIVAVETADQSNEIRLILPGDATGRLTVYSREEEYDEDYNTIFTDIEIGSADIEEGIAAVSLSSLPTGYNYIYANFSGNYDVEDFNQYVTINPKVTAPSVIEAGEESYIIVEALDGDTGNVIVSYLDNDGENQITVADVEIKDNQAKISLADLPVGKYELEIYYTGIDYDWAKYITLYVVDSLDFKINITECPDEIVVNEESFYVYFDLPEFADGKIILKIDEKSVEYYDSDYYSVSVYSENLTLGEHTLTLDFVSDSQKNSSDSVKFNVVVAMINIPDEIKENYLDDNLNSGIFVEYSRGSSGNITVSLDNEEFKTIKFDQNAYNTYSSSLPDAHRGTHKVTVTVNDDKYGSVSKSNVVDFDYDFIVSSDLEYGVDGQIFVQPPAYLGNGDLIISIDGKVQDWTFDQDIDQIIINSSDLSIGAHNLTVKYTGDDKYPPKEENFTFDVNAYISCQFGDIVEGTDEKISLTLPGDAKGSLNITVALEKVDDEEYITYYETVVQKTLPLVNGKAYYSLKDLEADNYFVSVSYTGDDYDVLSTDFYLYVVKDDGIDLGKDYLILGENKTISFTSQDNDTSALHVTLYMIIDPRGYYIRPNASVIVKDLEIPVVDGKVTYTFDNLKLGNYHLDVIQKYEDTDGYRLEQDFFVQPTKEEYKTGQIYDDNNKVFIELPDDATGKAILDINLWGYIDSPIKSFLVKGYDVDGPISIDLPTDLPAGTYGYLINYTGNYGVYINGYWSVEYGGFERFDPDMDVDADDVEVGEDAVVNITLPVISEGSLVIAVGDKTYDATIEKGKATATISDLKAGNYNVSVSFKGDRIFEGKTKVVPLTVSGKETVMNVELEGTDVLTVNVEVENATGKVKVNGIEATLVNGKTSVELPDLPEGYNTIAVTYEGDDKHDKANTTLSVFVMAKKQNNATITVDGVDYPVELDDGKAVINTNKSDDGNITVVIDGVSYPAKLVNGTAVINTGKSDDGNITVVVDGVSYPAKLVNGTAVVNTDKTETIVKKASEFSEITIGSDQSISLVLKDEDGNVIANAPIAYSVNGTAKTVKTDKNGNFVIEAANGTTIVIAYAGNDNITGTNTTIKLSSPDVPTVVKIATQFDIADRAITIKGYAVDGPANEQGIYYATTLLDEKGNPISNAYIEFAVNNKIYNRTTDENGTFNPYKLNMVRAGRYTMAFNFAGDDNYTNAFACVCVDLDKKPIKIKAAAKSYKAATKTKKYTATLSTIKAKDGKMYLSTKKVTLKVNGKTYTAKTNSKGQVTFKITNLTKKAKYAAVISYEGDKTYESATQKVKLTVK